jgi:hypothetical protein
MKPLGMSFMCRLLKNERGQAAVIAILTATTMMAVAGAGIETGHVYYAYDLLRASTNSAVLAGANAMPNTTQAATNVTTYSSQTGELNATALLTNVSIGTPTFLSLTMVEDSLQVGCQTSTGGMGGYNALSATQTATVNLWFGGLIGVRTINLSYTATAAMRVTNATARRSRVRCWAYRRCWMIYIPATWARPAPRAALTTWTA